MQDTFGGRHKIIVPHVPHQFRRAWSDYLKRWSTFVDYCVDMKNGVDDFLVFQPSEYADDVLPKGETRFAYPLHKPDPTWELEFDLLVHDGSDIFQTAENLLAGQADVDPALADELSNRFGIACDYMNFLRTDLRLDFAGIERRWRMVPLFLRPRHVAEHDLGTR